MKLTYIAVLQFFLTHVTGATNGQTLEQNLGTLGESVTLLCNSSVGNGTQLVTQWLKDGSFAAVYNHSSALSATVDRRFSLSENGSLRISGLHLADEGIYRCQTSQPDHVATTKEIQLTLVSGPTNVVTEIKPTTAFPNGTLFARKGATVSFNCSSESYPSQSLSWAFEGFASDSDILPPSNGSSLVFLRHNIQPKHQGNYSCTAKNALSEKSVIQSTLLLVYYTPDTHPSCYSASGNDSSHISVQCGWQGGYPLPTLHWKEELDAGVVRAPVLDVSIKTESLEVTLNRSKLYDGQILKCTGHYQELEPRENRSCSLTLKAPYPQGDPLFTVLEGNSVTLTCTEGVSLPPAKTTWRRSSKQEIISPNSKYIISALGPTFSLTIVNVTKQDEGAYFCRSENPLLVRELEVFLTVKSSMTYSGGVIGTFIAVLIVGVGIFVGISSYRNRDRICLGNGCGRMDQDMGDMLNLAESDEDEILDDSTSRITTTANGHITSLVQIHRIPSSDHEDLGNTVEVDETAESVEQGLDSN